MIGQRNNLSYLNGLGELPRFMVVLGPKGSGRRTLLSEVFSHRGVRMAQIGGSVDLIRQVSELSAGSSENAFCIDWSEMSKSSAGAILKVAEETPRGTWIAIIAESRTSVLPTLLSRARVVTMEPYSAEEFAEYAKTLSEYGLTEGEASVLSGLCDTPGDLFALAVLPDHGASLRAFAELVVNNVLSVPLANALMIPTHLALKATDAGKHDPRAFLKAFGAMVPTDSPHCLRMALATAKAIEAIGTKGLNRQMVMDEWVMAVRGESL